MISVGEIDPDMQKALAGMIPVGEIHPDMQKALGGMISVGEMHPDLVGLQESREKPYEMSTK